MAGAHLHARRFSLPFTRGDANADGTINIADPIRLLFWLFGSQSITCKAATDTNNDNSVDVSDGVYLVLYLFSGGPPPPEPFAVCGVDPENSFPCESYSPCPTIDGPNVSQLSDNQSETAVAINPCDPDNVVILAMDQIATSSFDMFRAVSWDGGLTWPVTGVVFDGSSGEPASCCDPSLAFDGFGNLYAAYLGGGADRMIHVAVSTDGGVTFSVIGKTVAKDGVAIPNPELGVIADGDQPTIVTGPASTGTSDCAVWVTSSQAPGIVAAGALVTGSLHGATELKFALYTVIDCSTFGEAGNTCNYGDVAVGPNGEVLVAYQDGVIPSLINPDWTEATCWNPDDPIDPKFGSGIFVQLRPPDHPNPPFPPGQDPPATLPFGAQTQIGRSQVCGGNGYDDVPAKIIEGVTAAPVLAWNRTSGLAYLAYLDAQDEPGNDGDDTNIILSYSDATSGYTVWLPAIPIEDPEPLNSQFFQDIAVDQTTGTVALCWYDCREDTADNKLARLFVAYSADPSDPGKPFTVCQVSAGQSDGSGERFIYGDYIGLDFHSNVFFPVWADASGLSGNPDGSTKSDVFTERVDLSVGTCGEP